MKVEHPGLVLATAILLSLPMAPDILDGAITPTAALVRFLIALLLCWAGGALVGSVLRRYGEESRRAEVARMIEQARQRALEQAQQRAQPHAPDPASGAGPAPAPAPGGGSPPIAPAG